MDFESINCHILFYLNSLWPWNGRLVCCKLICSWKRVRTVPELEPETYHHSSRCESTIVVPQIILVQNRKFSSNSVLSGSMDLEWNDGSDVSCVICLVSDGIRKFCLASGTMPKKEISIGQNRMNLEIMIWIDSIIELV